MMKKLPTVSKYLRVKAIVLLLIFTYMLPCQARPGLTGSSITMSIEKWTGLTAACDFIAGHLLAAGLSRKLHGKVKVKLKTGSFSNLLRGKIESINVQLHNCRYKDIPLGNDIDLATGNQVRYRANKQGPRGLAAPLLLKISGNISSSNLAYALANSAAASKLRALSLDLPGLGGQCLQFLEPQVTVNARGIVISSVLVTRGAPTNTGVPIILSGMPELVGDSRIYIRNLAVQSPDIPNPEEFAAFTGKLLNPIIDFARMDRLTHAFRLERLAFLDNHVQFNGNLLLAPKMISGDGCRKK